MIELNKKYIVVYKDKTIIAEERNNTGSVYPAFDCQYFETDNEIEFDEYIKSNNLTSKGNGEFI